MTPKGVHVVAVKRQGQPVRWYVYAWRGGPQIMTKVGGPRPSLDAKGVAALAQALGERDRAPAGTLAALAEKWRSSASWAALAPTTRALWGSTLSSIVARWGEVPLRVFADHRVKAKIIDWRDGMAAHPRKADYHIQVLRALLAHGVLRGELPTNIAEGIPSIYRGGNRAAIIWEQPEIERWQDAQPQVVDAVNLARLTGLRRADLVAVTLDAIGEHAMIWRTSKSRGEAIVSCPMIPRLRALIDELRQRPRVEGVQTLLVNSLGKPWTPGGLTASFTQERDRLGLPDKHLHDLRGTYATELCEAGFTDRQIADLLGWSPEHVALIRRLYVDPARTVVAMSKRLAGQGL